MTQFQENAWTDGWTEGRRRYFIGPFYSSRLPPGVQKTNMAAVNIAKFNWTSHLCNS